MKILPDMSSRFKLILGKVIITFVLLVVIESVCSTFNKVENNDIGFLFNPKSLTGVAPDAGFNEVDPLLGYSKTTEKLQALGFKVESNCAVLSTTDDTSGLINILITGGSTTDLSLDADNWPVEFCKILKEHGVKAKLYMAAVGGYNSGQELLKLIRDGLEVAPFIHLSYSGANDMAGAQSYVSVYEQVFYEDEFKNRSTSLLLPNTVLFLRNLLHLNHRDIDLHPNIGIPAARYWEKNMRLMHAIAVENNFRFIGLLQPVLGSGKFNQQVTCNQASIERQQKVSPEFREVAGRHPDFLVDLTAIFDTCKGNVYNDNCHIYAPYQKVVAMNIYSAMMQKKVFGK